MSRSEGFVLALSGGIGGAKLALGLYRILPPGALTVVANTGDDFEHLGLSISPDVDTLLYTLAGVDNPELGWGRRDETWTFMQALGSLGGETWFSLGDGDLATHVERTRRLVAGESLSQVTGDFRRRLGISARLLPMSDDRVRTRFLTAAGIELEFQDYFVRHHHAEEIASVSFEGAAAARPAPGVVEAIEQAERVIICPSNPVVSIGPILAVPGIREALRSARPKVVAVSPIVQGAALRGPAARLLPVVGAEVSASGVAGLYADICATFVVDRRDAGEVARIEALGLRPVLLETVMETPEVAAALAKEILALDLDG